MSQGGAFGIDIGSKSTLIATVKSGGIEILLNAASNRETPTVINFGDNERLIGEASVAQQGRNHKNTIPYVNRFMGLNSDCQDQLRKEKKFLSCKIEAAEDKKIYFNVLNKGEQIKLVPEQVFGAYLSKLKTFFAEHNEVPDVVLGVPPYFSAIERQAVLDACKIAGVNCLRLINDNTAVCIGYGFFKRKDFDEKKEKIEAFVDVGHGYTSVTIASFTSTKVKIIAQTADRNVGARAMDATLMNKIGEEFDQKYGCDPREAPKARLRLMDALEKTRKTLSGIQDAKVHIECLLEDEDLDRDITREEFETMIKPELDRIQELMNEAITKSGLKVEDIETVQMVGEGTRIPIIQEIAKSVFKKEQASRTLNSAEAVSRGCSLVAAMILPQFHVPSFQIEETNPFPVDVSWSVHDGSMKSKTLFPEKNNYPSIKSMTFDNRVDPIDVAVAYTDKGHVLDGIPHLLSRYHVEIPKSKHEKHSLKLRVKLDQNMIPGLDTAELIEQYKEEKKIPIKGHNPAPKKEGEQKEGEDAKMEDKQEDQPEQQYETKLVDKTKTTQINFKWEKHGLSANQVKEFTEKEHTMSTQDISIIAVKEAKNHLETHVYDYRNYLGDYGDWCKYMEESKRTAFIEELNGIESWLYGDGEHASKDQYDAKLKEIQAVGEPVRNRFRFFDLYPHKKEQIRQALTSSYESVVSIPQDSHITQEQKDKVLKEIEETTKWLDESEKLQNSMDQTVDPVFNLEECENKKNNILSITAVLLNTPKPEPKKEEPKKEEKDAEMKDNAAAPAEEDAKMEDQEKKE